MQIMATNMNNKNQQFNVHPNTSTCKMWCGGTFPTILKCKEINRSIRREEMKLMEEKDRTVYFSMVGQEPLTAKIAIVGLNPASSQLDEFINLFNTTADFEISRKESAFSNKILRKNLIMMLDCIGIPRYLKISSSEELFTDRGRKKVLMTSIVKCASLHNTNSQESAEWKVTDYSFSVECAKYRLINDLSIPIKLKVIFVLGKKATKALKKIPCGADNKISLFDYIENNIAPILQLPHPSGSNNGGVSSFLGEKKRHNRYKNIIKLREEAIKVLKKLF